MTRHAGNYIAVITKRMFLGYVKGECVYRVSKVKRGGKSKRGEIVNVERLYVGSGVEG